MWSVAPKPSQVTDFRPMMTLDVIFSKFLYHNIILSCRNMFSALIYFPDLCKSQEPLFLVLQTMFILFFFYTSQMLLV